VTARAGYLIPVALVGVLLASALAGVVPSGAPPVEPGHEPATATSPTASEVHPGSVPVGSAQHTLVLYNQTRFNYNASAISGTMGEDPGLAFDTHNDTGWATGLSTVGASTVDVFDPLTDLGIRQMVAGGQSAIAYDNRTDTMWVTGGDTSQNVTVFNATTYGVVRVIGTGNDPRAITYDWRTREMYVVDSGTDNVTIISDASYDPAALSPEVGPYAAGIAFDPASGNLFVSHQLYQNVTGFYQTGTGAHANIAISGAGQMGTIVDDPQNGMVYAVGDSPGVVIIDAATNSTVGTITLPHAAIYAYDGLAIDTADQRLYVSQIEADYYGNVVSYQPAPTASTVHSLTNTSTGYNAQPETLAYDPTDARILVCDTNQYSEASSNISEISTSSGLIVGSVGIQRLPLGSVYDPVTNAVYVYDGGNGHVYELGADDNVERSAFVGYTNYDNPDGVGISGQVAYDSANASIFVDWYTPDAPYGQGVAEFSAASLTFLRNWTGGFSAPSGIAYDSQDHAVYVANYLGFNATVISTVNYREHWVGTGEAPIGVTYDPKGDGIYVSNSEGDNVTVIDGATAASTASVSTGADSTPWGDLYDPANGYIYVADYLGGALTVINGATNTTASTPKISVSGINGPTWLTYDTVNETIVAAEPGTDPGMPGYSAIALVNATNSTYFGQLEYGTEIWGVVYDSGSQTLFTIATYPGAIYEVTFGAAVSSPPPIIASLVADPATIALGQSTDFDTDASGGTLPYTFTYSTPPTGCSSSNETPLPCVPTAAGTYIVGVNVTDPTGGHASAVTQLVVTFTPATLQVALTPTPSSIVLGGSLSLETTVSGGTGTGTYSFAYSTLPAGDCASQNLTSLPCTPSSSGTFYVGVNVTDADGNHGSASARFTVTAAPPAITATLTPVPSSVTLGNSSTLTVAVQGTPTGPLTYDFTLLPPGCLSSNLSLLVCKPTATGSFPLTVEVRDAAGHFAEANSSLTVLSATPSPPTGTASNSNLWVWILVAVILVIAVIVILIVASRRRKKENPPNDGGTASVPPPTGPN
jgi:YVTN family beta-propeller protein